MTTTSVPGRPEWTAGPLYNLLCDSFPTYRTKLNALDIQRLRTGLGKSHEAVYQWLRKGKLSPTNARKLIGLAAAPENATALKKAGREPPTLEDFLPFM